MPVPAELYKPSPSNYYLSPSYAATEHRQHVGNDIKVPAGTSVYAPVDGKIVRVRSSSDPMQSYVVIQETDSKTQYVLGHVQGTLPENATVTKGQSIGTVQKWLLPSGADNSHLHFGKNVDGKALPTENTWGWGRIPEAATPEQIKQHGWVKPEY